ncbi:MAG: hypothetical protein DRP13_04415 [Candidatus Aenigmatarchaeota archaeon]|nr:MAG: hypothetical protein DRP13_04415 [Candidatus Aenigmarchaeota archaeon]
MKYFTEEFQTYGHHIDMSQFRDLELTGILMRYKTEKESFWERIGVGGSIGAKPLIYNNTIYFGAFDKNFYALTLDGKEKWRFQTNGIIGYEASAADGIIYFGSFDGNVYAVNEEGHLVWKFHTNEKVEGTPMVYDKRVYIGSCDNHVYKLDAYTGEKIWSFRTNGWQTTPLVYNSRVYFGYGDKILYCTDTNGNLLWRFKTQGLIAAWPPAQSKGIIYIGNWDKRCYAINSMDGRLVWKFEAGDVVYPPWVDNERVYLGSRDGNVYCLTADTGKLLWKFPTQGFVAGPVVYKDTVFAGSYDNNLYAIDLSGKGLWKFGTNGFITYSAAYNNVVYFGSWDCNLYAVNAETGELLWKFKTSIGTPSPIEPPERSEVKTLETVWQSEEKEKAGEKKQEVQLSDYGRIESDYTAGLSKDYIKGKKGYVK